MTNREKFAKEIIELALQGKKFAVNKNTNKIKECETIYCCNCLFGDYQYCPDGRRKWANAEYKEKKEFSEADKLYVRAMDKFNWFARDRDGVVYGYVDKPFKNGSMWDVKAGADEGYELERVSNYTSATFESLSWEDAEPTSREEILEDKE